MIINNENYPGGKRTGLSGRIAEVILRYQDTQLYYIYISTNIQDEDDGSIVSENDKYGSGINITKMVNGFYRLERLVLTTRIGDIETTDCDYEIPTPTKKKPKPLTKE